MVRELRPPGDLVICLSRLSVLVAFFRPNKAQLVDQLAQLLSKLAT